MNEQLNKQPEISCRKFTIKIVNTTLIHLR